MFSLFLALTVLSVLALVAGFILLLTRRGRVSRQTGPEAGAQVMGDVMEEQPEPGQVAVARGEASVFVGTGIGVQVEADSSFAEMKQALRDRRWADALPTLLLSLGLVGLLLFGSLALLTGTDQKLLGIAAVAVVLYTVVRIARDLRKA